LQNVSRFKPEYILISIMIIMSIVLLLTLFSGLASIKDIITNILVLILLGFLTVDIQNHSLESKSLRPAYKYVVMMILLSLLTLF
jgi:fatty-acid desaturase